MTRGKPTVSMDHPSLRRLRNIWGTMKQRCNNPNHPKYPRYGRRGITVTSEWDRFAPFFFWAIANGYQDDLSIDRIDNDGNYEPANCRWATRVVQQNNREGVQIIDYKGESIPIGILARAHGIKPYILSDRIKNGWRLEDALSIPTLERGTYGRGKKGYGRNVQRPIRDDFGLE